MNFITFLLLDFLGGLGIPFGLQNTLPVIFNMKRQITFSQGLFGFIPHFFIWNTIGSGINNYIEQSEKFNLLNLILSKEIYISSNFYDAATYNFFLLKNKIFDDRY